MQKFAEGLLGFMSGNRLTVNHEHWSRIQQNLFEKIVKLISNFILALKTVCSNKPKAEHDSQNQIPVFFFFFRYLRSGIRYLPHYQ